MKLSVSQIKTFIWSKSKWAWSYILWIKDEFNNDSLPLGNLFEHYLITWQDQYEIIKDVSDMEKIIETYDTLKHNAIWLDMPIGDTQVKLQWYINDVEFVGYIDNLYEWVVRDIKTAQYLTKKENESKNMWSWLSYYEEYELQMWVYMKLGWYKLWKIAEISKHKYKDWKSYNQIIEFVWSDEWDKKMEEKYYPIINEIIKLYKEYER